MDFKAIKEIIGDKHIGEAVNKETLARIILALENTYSIDFFTHIQPDMEHVNGLTVNELITMLERIGDREGGEPWERYREEQRILEKFRKKKVVQTYRIGDIFIVETDESPWEIFHTYISDYGDIGFSQSLEEAVVHGIAKHRDNEDYTMFDVIWKLIGKNK